MKRLAFITIMFSVLTGITYFVYFAYADGAYKSSDELANPLINFSGFKKTVQKVADERDGHRVSLKEFLKMSKENGTIILDARSTDKYAMKHLKGAKHLAYTDFTDKALANVIPTKATRILIYCNNNFTNNSAEFATKYAPAALNISTYIALKSYGYQNVYELGPAFDERDRRLAFETVQ